MSANAPDQSSACSVMTFRPSKEEFKDFGRYVAYMESRGAHRAGMAKVIPPKGWKPRRTYSSTEDLLIPAPIQQVVTGQSGLFTQYNIQKKPMTVHEFRKTSSLDKFCRPRHVDHEDLERKFWRNLTFNPPLYGADVGGTLFEPGVAEWNLARLGSILDAAPHQDSGPRARGPTAPHQDSGPRARGPTAPHQDSGPRARAPTAPHQDSGPRARAPTAPHQDSGPRARGPTAPCLHFGMWKSAFAWHTEDMDLYSISYLHHGEPKSWYTVPPEHGRRLERLARGFFPGNAQSCEAFLRHKMTLIAPSILKKYGIPFEKVIQEAGQFIVTFPFGYHAGFNHGFNCAESTNFAMQRWIDYGKRATLCSCRQDMVKIPMDVFVRKFQPERYKAWKAGKDISPIDHSKPTPEAAQFLPKDQISPGTETSSPAPPEEPPAPEQDPKSPKPKTEAKRQHEAVEASEGAEPKPTSKGLKGEEPKKQLTSKGSKGEEPKKAKLSSSDPAESDITDPGTVRLEPRREVRPPRARAGRRSANRRSPARKERSEAPPPGPEGGVAPQAPGGGAPQAPGGLSPLRPLQRTPADVLHVHSYAKGDYGEEGGATEEPEGGADGRGPEEGAAGAVAPGLEELDQLPEHHPILKESPSDEEGPFEASPVEEEGLEGESWAKPLAHLWQSRPPNFKKEREYNQRMGSRPPFCSICMLFHTHQQSGGAGRPLGAVEPLRTKPLIPESCFSTSREEEAGGAGGAAPGGGGAPPPSPYLEEDGTSLLLRCASCSVRVHAACYGVDPLSAGRDWRCARCRANALTESCCLCWLRGGALQRTNNDKWVHVLCAVAVLEARFVNMAERSPVDLSGIPLQRFKLKCYYCKKHMKKALGCCVQCSHGRCPTAYHPTCAQAAGVLLQPHDWPFVVHVTCCRHKGPAQTERNKAAMLELTVGQRVICKHKNGRYYQCDVVQLSKETFYEVNFDDGSFSDNLFPEDIVSRDCAQLGPPPPGEVVQVRWTDGLVYGARFVAAHVIQMYLVEFEDGSQLTTKRDDVYTLEEELPKRVKSRLSKASDMRFDGIFEGKDIIRESKRQRVINSRYRGDYIEPVIYRAIME